MNAVEEPDIHEQLVRALEGIDPVAPPLAAITDRAKSRRRRSRFLGSMGAVALAGACALVAVVVISAESTDNRATVTPAVSPARPSLVTFANDNGAVRTHSKRKVIAGPFGDGSNGFYGAFAVKAGLDVVSWNGKSWRIEGHTWKRFGPGNFILKAAVGPRIQGDGPSLYVKAQGGDVSYFGYVLYRPGAAWTIAAIGKYDSASYGRPGKGEGTFISVSNDCTPDCASGTQSRNLFVWSYPRDRFVLVHSHKLKH